MIARRQPEQAPKTKRPRVSGVWGLTDLSLGLVGRAQKDNEVPNDKPNDCGDDDADRGDGGA